MTVIRDTKEVVLVARVEDDPPIRVTKEVVLVAYEPAEASIVRHPSPIMIGF